MRAARMLPEQQRKQKHNNNKTKGSPRSLRAASRHPLRIRWRLSVPPFCLQPWRSSWQIQKLGTSGLSRLERRFEKLVMHLRHSIIGVRKPRPQGAQRSLARLHVPSAINMTRANRPHVVLAKDLILNEPDEMLARAARLRMPQPRVQINSA